jgi:butyrate kinase
MSTIPKNESASPGSGKWRILVINPGSTSTKLSLFTDETEVAGDSVSHSTSELEKFPSVASQAEWRLESIRGFLNKNRMELGRLSAVAGRGGLLHPIESGVYRVGPAMLKDLQSAAYGEHACNLGGILAYRLAQEAGCVAYVADPVVVDEMEDIARVTGLPEIRRTSVFHALNQKSAAREAARRIGKPYEECRLIVAHLGGGISVGAHRNGRVIDTNNALDGEGPFAPERSGSLPVGALIDLCFSQRYTRAEMQRKIVGQGGLVAHRASNQLGDLRKSAQAGEPEARLLYEALVYRISQEIAKHGATLEGRVDGIVLTGGMSHDADLVDRIRKRVGYLAPVEIIPGEREMVSLASGVLAVLRKTRPAKEYTNEAG